MLCEPFHAWLWMQGKQPSNQQRQVMMLWLCPSTLWCDTSGSAALDGSSECPVDGILLLCGRPLKCWLQDACPACKAVDHKLGSCGVVLDLAGSDDRRAMLSEGLERGKDRLCEAAIASFVFRRYVKPLTQGQVPGVCKRIDLQQWAPAVRRRQVTRLRTVGLRMPGASSQLCMHCLRPCRSRTDLAEQGM